MVKKEQRTMTIRLLRQGDALLRVTGLLARRSIALDELVLCPDEEQGLWSMTLRANADEAEWRQLEQRLLKLVDVLQVEAG